MKSALRTPQSAVQREAELRAKEGEIGLAGWLKRYRFLSAQGQGSERTVLKWLIFPLRDVHLRERGEPQEARLARPGLHSARLVLLRAIPGTKLNSSQII